MNKEQPPQHSKLRQRIITRLNCAHTLLAIESDTNVGSLNHRNVVRSISYCQSDLIEILPHYLHDLCFLDR